MRTYWKSILLVIWLLCQTVALPALSGVEPQVPPTRVGSQQNQPGDHGYDAGFPLGLDYDAALPHWALVGGTELGIITQASCGYNLSSVSTFEIVRFPHSPLALAPDFLAARTGASAAEDATYLYQKVGAQGEHLEFGITNNPATRYTQEELAGGRLRIIAQGERPEMLGLERQLHETLPIGPEEAQKFYLQKQIERGLKPPPYNR